MEKFVDRIIETDRKAREIIEQAQQEKQAVLADAKKRADAEIARRETEADKGQKGAKRPCLKICPRLPSYPRPRPSPHAAFRTAITWS